MLLHLWNDWKIPCNRLRCLHSVDFEYDRLCMSTLLLLLLWNELQVESNRETEKKNKRSYVRGSNKMKIIMFYFFYILFRIAMRRSLNFALQHGRIYEKRKYMINSELCDAIGLVALRLFEFVFEFNLRQTLFSFGLFFVVVVVLLLLIFVFSCFPSWSCVFFFWCVALFAIDCFFCDEI